MVQVLIEDMQLKICRNCKVKLIFLNYEFILHGK